MKILLVTGELAENEVRDAASKLSAEVLTLPVSVAQFMSSDLAIKEIRKLDSPYDKIVFPGLTRFDVSLVETSVGMPCFKGPQHASDLVEVINGGYKLSKTEPADHLMEKKGIHDFKKLVAEVEKKEEKFKIGALKIGPSFPPRIMAEIVDAPLLSNKEVLDRARYYIKSGVDIIDVGAIAAEDNSDRLHEIVKHLKSKIKVPISVDSLNPNEINAGLHAGADLVLSLNSKNMEKVEKWSDVAYVVIPDQEPESLFKNLKDAEKCGFKKLIADPILSPPFKIVDSLSHYYNFRGLYHSQPVMMGVGNVIELMDADSVGINGLLGAIAVELDVSLLLTTENSQKTRNSVRELKRSIAMSFLAKSKGSLPKDLGFDLLLAKSKGKGLEFNLSGINVIKVNEAIPEFKADPKGHFNIFIDLEKKEIIVAHFKDKYDYIFEGSNAESLVKKILAKDLVSTRQHAAYLGREIQKAEVFLKLNKGYVQDEDFAGL